METPIFIIGQTYNRAGDIHLPYGGSRYSGISPSRKIPALFVFTGVAGKKHGYNDKRYEDGSIDYYGEGQNGPMNMTKGNKAINEHKKHGKALYLFEGDGKGHARFLGEFQCSGYEVVKCPDNAGSLREGFVFRLNPIIHPTEIYDSSFIDTNLIDIDQLREKALSAQSNSGKNSRKTTSQVYERSAAIRDYVLARANGLCECCKQPAPFNRKNGTPYLEAHHTSLLSEDGLDQIEFVGAICPNCHRNIHHGEDGEELNKKLLTIITELEHS